LILGQAMDFNCPMRSGMAPVFHLVFATDIDGDGHTMVGLNGKIVFDPNPSQPDLVTAPEHRVFGFVVNSASSPLGSQG